ncbi:hypothetical protein [Acidipropionibacterium thoenii]|uniref:hypothetical protein n=1 Tax=Acidipropionibacterium thoenii TaxID=1751 RepID=UPI0012B545CE|nr:hypothetical protein [Acidipropionibacterium thoenii]
MNWKKRPDTFILPRMKSEKILYVFEDIDIIIVAKLIDRSVKTVKGWIADWLCLVKPMSAVSSL